MYRIASIVFVLLLGACATSPVADRTSDDIREAVFRYQFENWNGEGAKAYYLDFGEEGVDPPDYFMLRFVGHTPPVKKVSQCKVRNLREGVIDSQTEEPGRVFRVTAIKWVDDSTVEVDGGYYENGLSASGNTYTVKKEDGKWRVIRDKLHWIS